MAPKNTGAAVAEERPTLDTIAQSMLEEAPQQEEKPRTNQRAGKPAQEAEADDTDDVPADDGAASASTEDDERNRPVTSDDDDEIEEGSILDDTSEEADEGDDLSETDEDDGEEEADSQEGVDEREDEDDLDTPILGEADDDRLVSVTVDGEEVEVPLRDLRERYAGEGAIDRRVQEATEFRNNSLKAFEQANEVIQAITQGMGTLMFRRTVPEPTDEMRVKNPQEYLIQRDLYDRETQAIQQAHGHLGQLVAQAEQQRQKILQENRQRAQADLFKAMPVLKDPVKGPKVKKAIVSAAHEFGFSDEEIAACADPRLFVMARAAARAMQMATKPKVERQKPKGRTMKPKAETSKPRGDAFSRNQKAAKARAKDTGSVDDVAQTMLVSTGRKRRRA